MGDSLITTSPGSSVVSSQELNGCNRLNPKKWDSETASKIAKWAATFFGVSLLAIAASVIFVKSPAVSIPLYISFGVLGSTSLVTLIVALVKGSKCSSTSREINSIQDNTVKTFASIQNNTVKTFARGSTTNAGDVVDHINATYKNRNSYNYRIQITRGNFGLMSYTCRGIPGAQTNTSSTTLQGIPDEHPGDCSFCTNPSNTSESLDNGKYLFFPSNSNTPLLIPTENPSTHWFNTPREVQLEMLAYADLQLQTFQKAFPDKTFFYELHCGRGAGQTVPHVHLRFEVQGGSIKSLDWKRHFFK
ncbi:MAG: hypothetical protein K940chlam9_00803 [Chlamydiae bacterium]|nr:hypothetical protein [Chlamydiota bacterium]